MTEQQANQEQQPTKKRRTSMDNWRDKRHRDREVAPVKAAKKVGRPKKRGRKKQPKKAVAAPIDTAPKKRRNKVTRSSLTLPIASNISPVHIYSYNVSPYHKPCLEKVAVVRSIAAVVEWLSNMGISRSYPTIIETVQKFDCGKLGVHKTYHGFVLLRDAEKVAALDSLCSSVNI